MQPVTRGMQPGPNEAHGPGVSAPRANGRVLLLSAISPGGSPHCPHPATLLSVNRVCLASPAPCPLSLPALSTLQITEQLQTVVSCKTAVSHAWLILPTSPAGCGHMSSPAGAFCSNPPRISRLRARGFSPRPSRSWSREKRQSGAGGSVAA